MVFIYRCARLRDEMDTQKYQLRYCEMFHLLLNGVRLRDFTQNTELGHNDLHKVQIKTSKGVVLGPNKWQSQMFAKSTCTEAAHHQSNVHGAHRSPVYHQVGSFRALPAQAKAKRGSR